MRYVLLLSEAACRNLSRALFRITRPEHLGAIAGDRTLYLFPWWKHPTRNEWAMGFDESYRLFRDPEARASLLDAQDARGSNQVMATNFGPLARDAGALARLRQYIIDNGTLDMAQVLAEVRPDIIRTEEQMRADGWFPETP